MDILKNNLYLLNSVLTDGQLIINLDILDSQKGQKIIKRFGISYNDDTLPQQIKKNFQDVTNVHSILTESPDACKVNTDTGVLTLIYAVTFPNGKKFQLEGKINLQQKQIPIQKDDTKIDVVDQKLQKLQIQINKIQEIYQNDTKQTKQIMLKLSKQIVQDISELKVRYEEMKNWKKQQQIKYKQLQIQLKSNKNNSHPKGGIPDQIMHIFTQKLDQQKQFFTDKLQNQAQKMEFMKDSLTRHQKLIDKISQQNIDLKKNVKQMEQKTLTLETKNELYQSKLIQYKQLVDKTIKAVINQQQQQQKIKQQIKNSPKKQQKQQQQQFNDPLLAFLQNIQQSQSPPPQMNSVSSPKAQQKTFIGQFMQIDNSCGYSNQFINNGKLITYNGISNQSTQLLGKYKINTHKFSYITVAKSKQNQIGFGIMDIKYINQRNSIKNTNCLMYYGYNGNLYDGGASVSSDGTGFRPGDKVKMRINLIDGVIQWSIGGIVTIKYKSQKLKDNKIDWVPFIRMCDRGDSLKWTMD